MGVGDGAAPLYREAMSSSYVHGSTDAREVERLVVQARFVAGFALESFDAPAGARVLDLGTGVGAMAAELARRYPGITLTGVDLSEAQLAAARAAKENTPTSPPR
jgi:cyclopropane fatty-acyl-phospholipid synthase-like methyltransferase